MLDRERGRGDRDVGVRIVRAVGVPGVLRRVRGAGDTISVALSVRRGGEEADR